MSDIEKSKAMTKGTTKKVKRMSKKAIQTIAVIQTSRTMIEASEKLGISRGALYERIQRYGLMEIIQDMKKEAQATIDMSSPVIAGNLVEVATGDGKLSKTQISVSQDLLDRAGVTKKDTKQQINIASQDMTMEFVQM